jgi:hypothetical protein
VKSTPVTSCVEELLRNYQNYDRAVDVVSAFEMLFTQSETDLPSTVRHFERFPKVTALDGKIATPDFSVVFKDGTGLAGEVSRIALHDASVDSLCHQLLRYDSLSALPSVHGSPEDVAYCDVLLLVPLDVGVPAIRRILHERMNAPGHWYKPSAPPCIVQFSLDLGRWVFQRPPDPSNGKLREGSRVAGVNGWLDMNSIKVKPERFVDVKAARPFINDSVDSLYLATLLWSKTFATAASAQEGPTPRLISTSIDEIVADLHAKYGGVKSDEVRKAMDLLQTAKLAEASRDGTWLVAWEKLHSSRERELERILARRACDPPSGSRPAAVRRQIRSRGEETLDQLQLFAAKHPILRGTGPPGLPVKPRALPPGSNPSESAGPTN